MKQMQITITGPAVPEADSESMQDIMRGVADDMNEGPEATEGVVSMLGLDGSRIDYEWKVSEVDAPAEAG